MKNLPAATFSGMGIGAMRYCKSARSERLSNKDLESEIMSSFFVGTASKSSSRHNHNHDRDCANILPKRSRTAPNTVHKAFISSALHEPESFLYRMSFLHFSRRSALVASATCSVMAGNFHEPPTMDDKSTRIIKSSISE